MSINKLCIYCKHFEVTMGEPDWAETTIGEGAAIECIKGQWSMNEEDKTTTEDFRSNIQSAATCDMFELAQD